MTQRSDKSISILFHVSLADLKPEVQSLGDGGVMSELEGTWNDIRIQKKHCRCQKTSDNDQHAKLGTIDYHS